MVLVLMALSDPYADFKSQYFSKSNVSKLVQDGAIVTTEHQQEVIVIC